ncbi:MAG: hybrid sensor histidine kinase/response regulator, partial [Proteobacteria bacterium]|nr:hybrid sensor histidine kinase/response regulator [Pseudomonadota bacterium]
MTGIFNPPPLLAGVRGRLKARQDSEHEQALVRVVIGVIATGYVLMTAVVDGRVEGHEFLTLLFGVFFLTFAVGNVVAILARPAPSPVRRVAGIVVDISVTCLGMHVQEGGGAPFYLFFLWVVFGNGFRFGVRYLFAAAVLSTMGFGLVALSTPVGRGQPSLVLAFLLPLLVLPVYVASLLRKLHEARARAEEASLAKSQFLANMSHEVRTPVNGILGSLDLLRRTSLDREQTDLLQTMRLSATGLLALLESVLDFSRLEAGSAPLRQEDFDLHLALQEVVLMFQAQAREKGLDLRLRVSPEVPYALHGDAVRLKQILANLVGNAVKFTEQGHVGLEVSERKSASGGTQVAFEVRDTGVGIPPEALTRIFERFTQADASVTRRFGGAGLGLAIAQHAVTLMGGSIEVESALGQGSRFVAVLPFRVQPPLAMDSPKLSAGVWDRPSVLLVACVPGVVGQIEEWLHAWGFSGHTVSSPEEACARLVSLQHQSRAPKLVIVFGQGLVGGPQRGAGILTEDPALRGTPLIFVSAGPPGAPGPGALPGYVAVLPSAPPKAMTFNALHLALASAEGVPVSTTASNLVWFRPAAAPQSGRKLRVLIADDNATNRKIAARILESAGHV